MLPGGIGWLGLTVGKKGWSRAWLYRTIDGGRSWERVGLDGLRSITYLRIFDSQHTVLLDEAGGNLYPTVDGGAHWQAGVLPTHLSGNLPSFFVSPSQGWLLAPTENGSSVPYYTSDGGQSWGKVSVPLAVWRPNSVSFRDTQTGWIGQQGLSGPLLLGTSDGGGSWAAVQLPGPPGYPGIVALVGRVVAFGNQALVPLVIVEGSQGVGSPVSIYVYSSSDLGQHWSAPVLAWSGKALLSGSPALALASPTVWTVAVGGNVRLSRDGGRSWAERVLVPTTAYRATDAFFASPAEGYVLLRRSLDDSQCLRECEALWRTVDGGTSWERVSLPELPADLLIN